MKSIFIALLMTFAVQTIQAQDFPATEQEVKELLCKKWTAKFLVMKDQKLEASAMGLEMNMTINTDMTYSMVFMNETMKGKWSVDMTKKTVTLYDEKNVPETLIKMLKKDEMSAEPSEDEEEDMKMILVPSDK